MPLDCDSELYNIYKACSSQAFFFENILEF